MAIFKLYNDLIVKFQIQKFNKQYRGRLNKDSTM